MMNGRPPPSRTSAPTAASLRELRGVVERITYQNPENGYTVARLAPERAGPEADAARGDDRDTHLTSPGIVKKFSSS